MSELPDVIQYSEIGNVSEFGFTNSKMVDLSDFDANNNLIKKIKKNDIQRPLENTILIPKVRPYLKKFVYVDKTNLSYFTKAFIQIKPKFFPILSYYFLLMNGTENINSVSRIGKGYPTLNSNDLSNIMFEKNKIENLLKKDKYIEEKVLNLHNKIRILEVRLNEENSSTAYIDDVFEKYFDWKKTELESLMKEKVKYNNFSKFGNNVDLRFSSKFHRTSGVYALKLLNLNSNKIKDSVISPIMTGKGISPKDYAEDSDCYYITMGDMSEWKIDYSNLKFVTETFEKNNSSKKPKGSKFEIPTKVEIGDILLMRSGEGSVKYFV